AEQIARAGELVEQLERTFAIQAGHPDTPPAVLLDLANRCPEEVLQNPALPLLLLSEPAAGAEILARAKEKRVLRQLQAALAAADERTILRFALECAARVLPVFERRYPDNDRVRRALEIAQRFECGLATVRALDAAERILRETDSQVETTPQHPGHPR